MATCLDSTESSSGPRGIDPYKECPTHCAIPTAHRNSSDVQSSILMGIPQCIGHSLYGSTP